MESEQTNESNYVQSMKKTYEKQNKSQLQKIASLEIEISDLKEQLSNYDNVIAENARLNQELSKMYEALQTKNAIITEFQNLTKLSSQKFEKYIASNNQYQEALEKKNKKYSDLKTKFVPLNQQFNELKIEHDKLIENCQKQNENNSKEIIELKDTLIDLENKYKSLQDSNNKLINEYKLSQSKIEELTNKILELNKYKNDFENIKNDNNN